MNNKPGFSIAVILIFLFLIFSYETVSQFSFYKNYTVNDGLPSSKVYHMIQDSKGYMWFATENGVSRFDGYEFKNYTVNDGLPTNSTLKLYEDYKGRIWFSSFTGQISYFFNGKIFEFILNDELKELNIKFFDHIWVDSLDNVTLTDYNGGVVRINSDQEVIYTNRNPKQGPPWTYFVYIEEIENSAFIGVVYPEDTSVLRKITQYKNGRLVKFINETSIPWSQKYFQKLWNKEYLLSLGSELKKISKDEIVLKKRYENNVIALYEDLDSNIWVSEEFNCVYMYPGGNFNNKPRSFLQNKSVSKILQDFEGNYWFSTTGNGVYLVPSIAFNYHETSSIHENIPVLTMVTNQERLFYSTTNKGIYAAHLVDNDIVHDTKFQLKGFIDSNISAMIITDDNSLWVTMSANLKYDFSGNRKNFISNNRYSGYALLELFDGSIILANEYGYFKFSAEQMIYNSEKDTYNCKTLAFLETPDSTLWLGSIEGLYTYKNGVYAKYSFEDEVLNSRISDLDLFKGQVLVGSFDNGMAIISPDSIMYVTEADGLNSNRIKVIYADEDSVVWVGTNRGLGQMFFNQTGSQFLYNQKYTIWDGLPSNEINDIVMIGNHIWLGTDDGISSFHPEEMQKSLVKPVLQIENVSINENNAIHIQDVVDLKYNENNIIFKFKALSYRDPGNINYLYKLDGLENEWIETKNTSVRYSDLAPNAYNFIVKAESIDGIWSDTIEFDFLINKHFSQTALFRFLMVLAGLGLISIVFWIILKNQKNKETLKHQVILAEQKAIRSQMNPHFLFNSLNSIQHLILNKEGEVANYYLTNLSKLMRKILDNSKHTTIPLKDELENIKLYLDLEKFRFENHFDYKVEICDSILVEEVVVPSMIIQPYLENAIWHGLVPKGDKGTLILSITKNDQNNLMVVIEDDGIGRIEAEKIAKRRKNYKSMGMKNTKERMNLLNRLFNTNYNVAVIDLLNGNNESQGTRIELTIDM